MQNVFKKVSIFAIIIGVIGISMITLFGYGTITYLEKVRIEGGLWYYKYNFANYMRNLTQTIGNTTPLQLTTPQRQWINDITGLGNNLALIMDWLIMILNVIMYPIRVGAFILQNNLALIGIDMIQPPNTGIKWLIDLIQSIVGVQIPYI